LQSGFLLRSIEICLLGRKGLAMSEDNAKKEIEKLLRDISKLPVAQREKVLLFVEQTKKTQGDIRESMKILQDSIDKIRGAIKYLLFDLEATRRENTYFKGLLEKEGE